MSTIPSIQHTDNPLLAHGGLVWNRLHSEREGICGLLNESKPSRDTMEGVKAIEPGESAPGGAEWRRRELLHSRLRDLDDALDRLLAGSYGDCAKCGRWIEDTRLAADPALAFCLECQQRESEEGHAWRILPKYP